MTMTDPSADMLTRIRNANVAMHDELMMPSSKLKQQQPKPPPPSKYLPPSPRKLTPLRLQPAASSQQPATSSQ